MYQDYLDELLSLLKPLKIGKRPNYYYHSFGVRQTLLKYYFPAYFIRRLFGQPIPRATV